jgi:membrane fusion protein (multidrug efflux system)
MRSLFFPIYSKTSYFLVVAIILVGAFYLDLFRQTPLVEAEQPRRVNVLILELAPETIRDVISLPGEAGAWREVRLAAETAGRVENLLAREGDRVRQGQVLAHIDVTALGAGVARAKAGYELIGHQLRRREQLFKENIISKEELDLVRAEYIQAREALRQAEIEYNRGLVKAPISGWVNNLFIEAGEFVDRGQAMLELVNIDKLKFQVQVPEMDVRFLEKGQVVQVTMDAYQGQVFQGIVDFIAFKADPATKTFRTQVVVDNPGDTIRPGMIARVTFVRRTIENSVVVPLSAVIDRDGERLVYVVENGVARARAVSIGVIERDRVQITAGLAFGDRLIIAGQWAVEDGTIVVVQ